MKHIKKFETYYIKNDDLDDFYKITNLIYLNEIERVIDEIKLGKININATTKYGFTPLMYITAKYRYDLIVDFIKLGADVFKKDINKHDFLDYANDYNLVLDELKKIPELYDEYMKKKDLENIINKYNL